MADTYKQFAGFKGQNWALWKVKGWKGGKKIKQWKNKR